MHYEELRARYEASAVSEFLWTIIHELEDRLF